MKNIIIFKNDNNIKKKYIISKNKEKYIEIIIKSIIRITILIKIIKWKKLFIKNYI